MKYVTFRESESVDVGLIPTLLDMLGYREIPKGDIPSDVSNSYGTTIEVEDDKDLDELKQEMSYLIDRQPMFADMGRCAQTLQLGLVPDEEWFNKEDRYPLTEVDLSERMDKRLWSWVLELRDLSGEVARIDDGKVELYENALAASKHTGVPMVKILADLRHGKDERYYSTLPWTKKSGFYCKKMKTD